MQRVVVNEDSCDRARCAHIPVYSQVIIIGSKFVVTIVLYMANCDVITIAYR